MMKRPKRPLSAYNLFYRFKRDKILSAHKKGDDSSDAIRRLIAATPGLEENATSHAIELSPEQVNEIRRKDIRTAMQGNISPKDNRNRSHRKTHGAMGFLEMGKLMVTSWKAIDDFARSVFEELAEEGREDYRKRVAEYEEIMPPNKKMKMSIVMSNAAVATPDTTTTLSKNARTASSAAPTPKSSTAIATAATNILPVVSPAPSPKPKMARPKKRRVSDNKKPAAKRSHPDSIPSSRKINTSIPSPVAPILTPSPSSINVPSIDATVTPPPPEPTSLDLPPFSFQDLELDLMVQPLDDFCDLVESEGAYQFLVGDTAEPLPAFSEMFDFDENNDDTLISVDSLSGGE